MDPGPTKKQSVQEEGYKTPYHWFKSPDTYDARLYFGYLNRCIDLAKKYSSVEVSRAEMIDVGCGDGRFLGILRDRGFTHLTGVDYSKRATAFATLLVPEADIICADVASMAHEGKKFDIAFFIETLEHIPPEKIPSVIENIRSVLNPEGLLVVTVPSLYGGAPHPAGKHYQHFTVESLTSAVTVGGGFSQLHIEGQDRMGVHALKVFYKMIDNDLWDIVPVRKYYNTEIWPRMFNVCPPHKGRRLVSVFQVN